MKTMKTIRISAEAHTALLAQSDAPWDGSNRANPDGSWDIAVDDDVITGLEELKHPGESYSDVIIRMAATQPKDGSTRRSFQ